MIEKESTVLFSVGWGYKLYLERPYGRSIFHIFSAGITQKFLPIFLAVPVATATTCKPMQTTRELQGDYKGAASRLVQ